MKFVILYTMEGCPHCENLKDLIYEDNLDVEIRNIDDHQDEYKQFVELQEVSIYLTYFG